MCKVQTYCRLKGKDALPKLEDLLQVPNECDFKQVIQKAGALKYDIMRLSCFQELVKQNLFQEFANYFAFQPYLGSFKNIVSLAAMSTPTYFPLKEFSILEEPIKMPEKSSVAMKCIERLNKCPKGKEGWLEFQNLCKKIFEYLFVPPLLGPFEQSRTETGLHIRDLIFDIPYTVGGFWGYIRDKFDSSALVIECKNCSLPIKGMKSLFLLNI